MSAIAEVLEEAGYSTFLSHRDGVEAFALNTVDNPFANLIIFDLVRKLVKKAAFAVDIYQIIEGYDSLVFNVKGRVPDEGGSFKASLAFAVGKAVVIYRRNHHSELHGDDNAMISGLTRDFSTVGRIERIPVELSEAAAELTRRGGRSYSEAGMPHRVELVVELGREVWDTIKEAVPPGARGHEAAYVLELVSERLRASASMRRLSWL
ncbi:MAG: hypothetical protein SWK76_15950 [Actinomycetota bacterium]|nr:hypothetical protein [Actinomycetota bacterium]